MKELKVFFGHHKCATKYVRNICDDVAALSGWEIHNIANESMIDGNLTNEIQKRNLDFLMYTNAKYERVSELEDFKAFHIVRDPRDIVVSAYFSHKYSHTKQGSDPAFEQHREKIQQLNDDDGILLELEQCKTQFEDMFNWDYSNKNIFETKLEKLMKAPYQEFIHIFEHMNLIDDRNRKLERVKIRNVAKLLVNLVAERCGVGMDKNSKELVSPGQLLQTVYNNRFESKSKGRSTGQEDKSSHYRKGVAGDWRNHFKPQHIEYFKNHYNELLIKLQYEKTSHWN